MWPADSLPNATLVTVGIYVTNLNYLEDGSFCFMELLDGGTEESNRILVELDTAAVILETDDQNLPDLIDSESEWANKKKKKVERRQQREIYLAQAIAAGGTPLSLIVSTCRYPLFLIASAGDASANDAFASNVVASDALLSLVVSARYYLFSSIVFAGSAGGASVSANDASASDAPSSLIATSSSSSSIYPAGFRALFLPSTLSCARRFSLPSSPLFHFSLPSSPTLLACNQTLFTEKRLFDQVFITQRLIAST